MSGVSHWFCASPVPQHWEIDWSRLAFQCTLIPLTAHLAAKRSCLEGLLLILWSKLCGHGVVILCFCERTFMCVFGTKCSTLLLLSVKVQREGYNSTVPVDANVFQDACENVGIDCVSHCRVERMLQDYVFGNFGKLFKLISHLPAELFHSFPDFIFPLCQILHANEVMTSS